MGIDPHMNRDMGAEPNSASHEFKETDRFSLYGRLPADLTRAQVLAKLEAVCRELDRVDPEADLEWARNISMTRATGLERYFGGNRAKRTFALFFLVLMKYCRHCRWPGTTCIWSLAAGGARLRWRLKPLA